MYGGSYRWFYSEEQVIAIQTTSSKGCFLRYLGRIHVEIYSHKPIKKKKKISFKSTEKDIPNSVDNPPQL